MGEQVSENFETYQRLKAQAQDLLRSGQLPEAVRLLEQAVDVARFLGDSELLDRAVLNRIGFSIELGTTQQDLVDLGKILLRSTNPEISFLAAYNLSWAYKARQETTRAVSYATRALECAHGLGRADWIASAHNQKGISLLAGSYFEEASEQFAAGLASLPSGRDKRRAVLLDNFGYCQIVRGNVAEGFRALFQSLRMLRRLGERWVEPAPRVSLCFAFLEVGKVRAALRHGLAALVLAEELGDAANRKSALYLLGEVAKQAGDELGARRHFQQLQETFYPQVPDLIEMLLVVDARTMVNLKA